MDELEFYDGAWTGAEIDAGIGLTETLSDALAIVVDGNQAAVSAIIGQYVIVKNSTITGISDGLYEAAKALPANTELDGTYFSPAVTAGGLNDLKAALVAAIAKEAVSSNTSFPVASGTVILVARNSVSVGALYVVDVAGALTRIAGTTTGHTVSISNGTVTVTNTSGVVITVVRIVMP